MATIGNAANTAGSAAVPHMGRIVVSSLVGTTIEFYDFCIFGTAAALVFGTMGLTFAPLGALLPELFPVSVRYTGAASTYNLGGILGASLAPSLALVLERAGGVTWVGYYIAAAGILSFLAVFSMPETRR